MQLARPKPPRSLISLVSMIDVLMIMLIFFMVTSTYLDLDMIPLADRADVDDDGQGDASASAQLPQNGSKTLLIRLGADGVPYLSGRRVPFDELSDRLASSRDASVVILPSGQAEAQALVSLIDHVTEAGVGQVRLVRLEAQR